MLEDTKGAMSSGKSKRNREQSGQKKKGQKKNIRHKTKDLVPQTPLHPGVDSGDSEG